MKNQRYMAGGVHYKWFTFPKKDPKSKMAANYASNYSYKIVRFASLTFLKQVVLL